VCESEFEFEFENEGERGYIERVFGNSGSKRNQTDTSEHEKEDPPPLMKAGL